MLTTDPSKKSIQKTCKSLNGATSSLEEGFGILPLGGPATLPTKPFGRVHAPASRSRTPVKEPELPIQGIYGPTFTDLLPPPNQVSSLVNRLVLNLGMIGSTESPLTWKVKTTNAKRSIYRLVPSTRPTREIDYIGSLDYWGTPMKGMGDGGFQTEEQLRNEFFAKSSETNVADSVKWNKRSMRNESGITMDSENYWREYEWRTGKDGKSRRVKPGISLLAPRFSDGLDNLFSMCCDAWKEIEKYGLQTNSDPDEILRVVWEAIQQKTSWKEQSTRVCFEFYETEILLDFLLCVEATRGRTENRNGWKVSCEEINERILRGVWLQEQFSSSSCGREREKQYINEFTNTLFALSFFLARLAETYGKTLRQTYAVARRVNLLHIGGNAIVPSLAEEFIKAYIESREGELSV